MLSRGFPYHPPLESQNPLLEMGGWVEWGVEGRRHPGGSLHVSQGAGQRNPPLHEKAHRRKFFVLCGQN